jgi:3-hydroxymyristoyl/3-hydroxydecanoyl-(acyl carrier protein) dehydratase
MKPTDNLYYIAETRGGENDFGFTILLNRNHDIYLAHFPGNPIMPGACIIQMCKELMERRTGRHFYIREVIKAKFLAAINPDVCNMLQVDFSRMTAADGGLKVYAAIRSGDTTYVKLHFFLQYADFPDTPGGDLAHAGACIIIPTYNNAELLGDVLDAVLPFSNAIIVVNDGSTDDTEEVLDSYQDEIVVIAYDENRGKGYALRRGFDRAEEYGFTYALTMDSDGQHDADDIRRFIETIRACPDSLLVGSRDLAQADMPRRNALANRFSNFWFMLQTGVRLPDTQTGFRLYPLRRMDGMRSVSNRYEAELELLIRSAWRGIPLIPVPVGVTYLPEDERVTHFRPFVDFLRISILNTFAVFGAIVYGHPARLIRFLINRRRR